MVVLGRRNTLDMIKLSAHDIEEQIKGHNLWFPQERTMENVRLPMYAYSFYREAVEYQVIPDQPRSFARYKADNDLSVYSENEMLGIHARHNRAQPSLVRDLHLGVSLKSDYDVFYNPVVDVENGVDLVIEHNGLIGLNLYTDTPKGRQAREWKLHRHEKLGMRSLDLPIKFKGSLQVGGYYLYGDREREYLKNELLERGW